MEQGLEYFGVVTGLLYLWLEIKQHKAMWVVGFISSLTYVFVFFFSKFYAVMALNVYYVLISIYGFLLWSRRRGQESEVAEDTGIVYHRITLGLALCCGLVSVVLFGGVYYVLNNLTDSPVALGDAFTTALSIVATWMLAHRFIEHWPCWVLINSVSAYLYYSRELYPTMFLYLCFAVLAIVGYYNWKKKGSHAA